MILLLIGLSSIIIIVLFSIGLKHISPDKRIYLFEVGYFYPLTIVISTLLATLPLYLTESLEISPLDNRFIKDQFDYKDAETIGFMYLLYLGTFCVTYLYFRRGLKANRPLSSANIYVSISSKLFIIIIYILFELYLIAIRSIYQIQSDSYVDTYIMYKTLPLFLQQITGVIIGSIYIVKILLLVVFFQNYQQNKILILGFIGYNFIETLIVLGERTNLVMLIVAYLILYQTLVKAIPIKKLILLGIIGIVFVTFLGDLRNTKGDFTEVLQANSDEPLNGGEFEIVFLNSVDVYQLKKTTKMVIPTSLYFSGLVSIIPQQLLPFEKTTYADWYIGTYYPESKEKGNGLAFGVVAESIVGFGIPQLILHAIMLAYVFARLHKHYLNATISIEFYCFYIWVTLFSYYCFRFNTFYLIPLIAYRFLPVNLLFGLLNKRKSNI